jgi:hypothetical protein
VEVFSFEQYLNKLLYNIYMQYAELDSVSDEERMSVLEKLSTDELADLWDQKPYNLREFTPEEGRRYFDDIESLHEYMRRYYVPESKPWRADEAASHELAHAKCALAVGAVGVKYYALDSLDKTTRNAIFTQPYGPVALPNLAFAAIAVHPYTAGRSIADMRNIRSYGYRSREHVAERIVKWNQQNNGLFIPEPQLAPVPY